MILRKSAKVAGTANIESTTELLVGTAEEPKHVRALLFTEYTAAEESDALIRVYRDTVKVCEFPLYHYLNAFDSATKVAVGRVELDLELPEGVKLEVGHLSGGTASDMHYTAEYELTRR